MNKNRKLRGIVPCALLLLTLGITVWALWANTAIMRTHYTIHSARLPQAFEGFCIAQVADLHNAEMGTDNRDLLALLEQSEPDIIVITGDLIDANRTDTAVALDFLQKALRIAPCYMVTGNHESAVNRKDYLTFEAQVKKLGVQILHNRAVTLERGGESIVLLGLDDVSYTGLLPSAAEISALAGTRDFTVMLSHRPEHFERYAAAGIDVTFSGHAHGGQFRLPLIGGIYAPGQGFLPEYDCGVYTHGHTSMVVSRGIGNSSFPLRLGNRPELVVVTLSQAQQEG